MIFQVKACFEQMDSYPIDTEILDAICKNSDNITAIKLDTQGTELEILKGAEHVLSNTQYILTEMNNHQLYRGGCQYYQVDEYLRERGFKLMDLIITYRDQGRLSEYDAIYVNRKYDRHSK